MGNSASDECPPDAKRFIPADVLRDLQTSYKAIAAKAEGRTWEDAVLEYTACPQGCHGVLRRLVQVQRGKTHAGRPAFASYCQAYHELFTDLDMARRTTAQLRLAADAEVVDLEVFFSSMAAFIGYEDPETLRSAVTAGCELEDTKAVAVAALARIVMGTFHGLTGWLQALATAAYLGDRHPLALQARQYLHPSFAAPSQSLSPAVAAALALALPQWTEPATRAHGATPRPHCLDVRRPPRGDWRLLFDLQRDGRSINSLVHNVVGYAGPTLLFVSTAAGDVFGAYVPVPWTESAEFQGNSDCFLFTTKPTLRFIPTVGSKGNYMYFNATLKSKEKHLEKGLGFGGRISHFRVYLDAELRAGRATDFCATFTRGSLTAAEAFTVEGLEVWGCGDPESLARLQTYQATISAEVQQGKKVDRRAMFGEGDWRESTDAAILQLAGLQLHSLEVDDRLRTAEGEGGPAAPHGRVLPVG